MTAWLVAATTDSADRGWLGPLIGGGLLALAGWTLWRGARVKLNHDQFDYRHDEDRAGPRDEPGPDEDRH